VFDAVNEPDFVRRAMSGDSDAFHHLFDLLAGPLAGFIERMGVPVSDAEEIAADALIKVQKSLPKYRPHRGAKLTTWVFEIGRNCAIDYRRRASQQAVRHEEFCLEYSRGNVYHTVDTAISQTKNAKAIDAALAALSPADRDILRMREVMEYSEIARAEQATEQAVRVRHKRALDRLKEQISQGRTHG